MQNYIEHHFSSLLKTSWQGAVLILLVLGVQRLLGPQLKPRWRYALWLLVMVRLALPLTIPSPASLFNLVDLSSAPRALATKWKLHFTSHTAARPPAATTAQNDETSTPESAAARSLKMAVRCALGLWAAGVFTLAISLVVMQYRLTKKIHFRRPLIDAPVLQLLEDCKLQMSVHVPVTLVETSEVGSPTLFGFIRPRILLPAGLISNFSSEELRYVFLHELSHIKRRDILAGWLMTALQILHWFNPLVWFAAHRMRVDRELACDALALSYSRDEENQRYGQTIIKLLESFGRSAWSPGLAGAVENKNQLKERIHMIAKFKKSNRGLTLALALFAGLGLITLTDARSENDGELAKQMIGTWVLVGAPGDVGVAPVAGGRYKHITGQSWSVDQANPETGVTLFHHGGTYTLEGDQYHESVEYANDNTKALLHKTNTFTVSVKGDTFTQVGKVWKEVWKRVTPDSPKPQKIELAGIEGTWQGHDNGADDKDQLSLVIRGSSIEFHETDTNDWMKGSFTVYDTNPKQLIAVITEAPSSDFVGIPVFAICEVKDGKFTVAGYRPGSANVPASFDATGARKIVFTQK